MTDVYKKLKVLMADTYALYLKTQNYHWHVTGVRFQSLHALFEEQYQELALAVDAIAERIRVLNDLAPATFKEFESLKTLKDGNSNNSANQMVIELAEDNNALVRDLNAAIRIAQDNKDEGTVNLLADRIEAHEKARWMLNASTEASS